MSRLVDGLDHLAVWWLDRHCRRWQHNRDHSGSQPPCVNTAYYRARAAAEETTR